ncbi:hypothetical protein PanWU01x14_342870 [Parasponia andersonii]|uniref:Uncharacterized protein n=1 Tax=Parasponia andersonii TaxID=3476 RepID=A0A2P5ADK2_PARAD|nr:hypothetical protein PanWU01x14_342870 [Parasponia andersonii]
MTSYLRDENILDLPCARRSVPSDMTQGIWNKCVDYFIYEEFRASSSVSDSSTQPTLPRTDETLIADKVLGVRRGYRRGVGPKLKGATSTSSTATSPPWDSPVPDSELRDFFSQTQSYLVVIHQREAVLLVQRNVILQQTTVLHV